MEKINNYDFHSEVFDFAPLWIETVDRAEETLYSDTDSAYLKIKLPFEKFENIEKTVDYTQDIALTSNGYYGKFLNENLQDKFNLNPKYNLMDFKSEVVAVRGFFRGKKYYSLLVLWNEGTYYDQGKIKKTGGQIVKSDVTKITFDLLNEVYFNLTKNFDITTEEELYYKIFNDLKKIYSKKLELAIKNLDIEYFGIPKKWGVKEFKSLPMPVKGAMFYNLIFKDNLRPGESFIVVQVKLNNLKKILDIYNLKNKNNELSPYMINKDEINKKLNVISIPVGLNEKDKNDLLKIFKELDIELDFDTIMNFNIDMKLDQFKDLFDEEIQIRSGI